jgi:filamentous hemagglutinin family protein
MPLSYEIVMFTVRRAIAKPRDTCGSKGNRESLIPVAGGVRIRKSLALIASLLPLTGMHANPTGGAVTHGSATIDRNGNVLTINQGTDRLIMGWQAFSIGQGETTRFVQPSSASMALNRVTGGTRSMIEGRLEANGGVILINPAGITVTKSGVVNVNTFIGSTHDITDDEFLKGGALNFKGTSDASVENLGTIHAETGDIALIARTVRNEGTLSARKGVVGLAAGDEVLYQPNADERLLVKSQTASASSIHHSGSIQAAAAEIKAAGNPYAVAINLDGIVEARGNAARNIKPRVIVHAAQGDIKVGSTATISASDESGGGLVKIRAATGNLQLDGKVAANSSIDNGGKGGEIQILGNTITLSGTALLDASGATGGGKIFVGGDYQGGANPTNHYASEPLQNASTLRIDKGAVMNADATVKGDGGVVINWADGTTISSGAVSVRGGPLAGNGGFVEISGKQNLGFDGTVNVGAVNGTPGIVLFDPAQIQITSATDLRVYSEPAITSTATNQISYTDYSTNIWVMSQSFFTNFTSGTIILQAYNISFEDPTGKNRANIVLNPNVNLEFHSMAGVKDPKIYLPSAIDGGDSTRSTITASGTGYVKLDASQGSQLVIHGDITTAAGDIILIAQNDINFAGASLKSTSGNIVVTSLAGKIDLFSTVSPAKIPTSAKGSSISSGSGTITIVAPGQIYLGGSSVTSETGDIALTSTAAGIKLFSDYYFPDGTNGALIPATIQSVGGTVVLNGATGVELDGATVSTTTGAIQISSTNGGVVLDVAKYKKDVSSAYGSAFAGTMVCSSWGPINLSSKNDVKLIEATLVSINGGRIAIVSDSGNVYWTNSSGIGLSNFSITSAGGGSISITSSGDAYPYINIFNSSFQTAFSGSVALSAIQTNAATSNAYYSTYLNLRNSTISTDKGGITLQSTNSGAAGSTWVSVYNSALNSSNGGSVNIKADGDSYAGVGIAGSSITTSLGNINIASTNINGGYGTISIYNASLNSSSGGNIKLSSSGALYISGTTINTAGTASIRSLNYIYLDSWYGPGGSTNAFAAQTTIDAALGIVHGTPSPTPVPTETPPSRPIVEATPAPTATPAPLITQATIVTEPTVQTAVQSLTIRNNTTVTSSGSFGSAGPGSDGSSGPGSEGSGSGGESASAGEMASSGEPSSSESGGETASTESTSGDASESAASETSTASTDSGSGAATASTTTASSSSSSGSTSTATASSSSSSGGSATSSASGSSQGARSQAAAISRMNNPVGGATVGGAEFQRLNPFSDAGSMHEQVATSSGSTGGGTTQASTGRAAAVSVKSPEMTELAPMNDLNVLFMMF